MNKIILYNIPPHYGEVVEGTQLPDESSNQKQDLQGSIGKSGAAASLLDRYTSLEPQTEKEVANETCND